jgi:hypothetical protein
MSRHRSSIWLACFHSLSTVVIVLGTGFWRGGSLALEGYQEVLRPPCWLNAGCQTAPVNALTVCNVESILLDPIFSV